MDDVQRADQRGRQVGDLLLHLHQLRGVAAAGRVAQPALRREQPHVQTVVEPQRVQVFDQPDAQVVLHVERRVRILLFQLGLLFVRLAPLNQPACFTNLVLDPVIDSLHNHSDFLMALDFVRAHEVDDIHD